VEEEHLLLLITLSLIQKSGALSNNGFPFVHAIYIQRYLPVIIISN